MPSLETDRDDTTTIDLPLPRHALDSPPTGVATLEQPTDGQPRTRAEARAAASERSTISRTASVVTVGALTAALAVAAVLTNQSGSEGDTVITTIEQTELKGQILPQPSRAAATASVSPTPSVSVTTSTTSSASPTPSAKAAAASPTVVRPKARISTPKPPTVQAKPGAVLDGRRMGGWYAGASGIGIEDGSFADWLGQDVTVTSVWADTDDENQRNVYAVNYEYADWPGAIDIAVGGTVLWSGENYADAARGAYDERWREAAANIARGRRDATGPTFVRPFHEMNGTWYQAWTVTRENSADFKKAFARYVSIIRQALPEAYIAWSPNFDDHTGLPVSYWYPGDEWVDVVAVDYYDDGHSLGTQSVLAWNLEADDYDHLDNPIRPESWRRFAADHGKPIAFPEWGLKPEGLGSDHPRWIEGFNKWLNKHANTTQWQIGQQIPAGAAGKVLYSSYFNVSFEGKDSYTIFGRGANPHAAQQFRDSVWGRAAD